MNIYTLTEEQLSAMKASVDRLSKLSLLLPGAPEYAMQGNENRRELLTEMIEKIDKPADMNEAVAEAIEQLRVVLCQIEIHPI